MLKTFIAIVILLVLLLFFMPPLEMSRGEARRTQCKINLKRIGIALNNYASTYGAFPPAHTIDEAGNPLHSWRTLILPFLEEEQVYNQINLSKPWDDPANAEPRKMSIFAYVCPEVSAARKTLYMAVVTPESFLHQVKPAELPEAKDGPQSTIMLIEVPPDEAAHWMEPIDADEAMVLKAINRKKPNHHQGTHVGFVDGSVALIPPNFSRERIHNQITAVSGDRAK